MGKNTIHKALENLDAYLLSIKRNVDTEQYELEVGFRKDWVFKSTDDIECNVDFESESGTLVTISGKHDEVTVDDLIEFVDRVIETNRKITEMHEKFGKELEQKKEELANEILKFEEEIENYKDSSFETKEKDEKPKLNRSSSKNTKILDEDKLLQKIS